MNKAIQFGGNKLDHFDGYLTGFYKKLDFILESNDFFIKEYAPEKWNYKKVSIDNPNTSIYVNEIDVSLTLYSTAKERYDNGMPDIVYRIIK
jgi:hypothetical protein